jgi:hypothetical protein
MEGSIEQACMCAGARARAQGSYFEDDWVRVAVCPTITVQ